MPFHIGVAYAVAIITAGALALMGLSNQAGITLSLPKRRSHDSYRDSTTDSKLRFNRRKTRSAAAAV
jgi:hypothetical protein